MRVFRVQLPDGRYYQRWIEGQIIWTEDKDKAKWWRREGGARNAAQWLINLGHITGEGLPTRHRKNPSAYVAWNDEDEPESKPGDG